MSPELQRKDTEDWDQMMADINEWLVAVDGRAVGTLLGGEDHRIFILACGLSYDSALEWFWRLMRGEVGDQLEIPPGSTL